MSSFFTLPGSAKRKRADANGNTSKKVRPETAAGKKTRKPRDEDDEISSDSEVENNARLSDDESDEELKNETAAEKRLRLAQHYLDNIRKEVGTLDISGERREGAREDEGAHVLLRLENAPADCLQMTANSMLPTLTAT